MESKDLRNLEASNIRAPFVTQFRVTLTATKYAKVYKRVPFDCRIMMAVIKQDAAGGTPAAISLKQNKVSAGYIENMKDDWSQYKVIESGTNEMTATGLTVADLSGNCILFGGANGAAGSVVMTAAVATATGNLATVDTDTTLIRTYSELKKNDVLCLDIAAQGTGTPTIVVDVFIVPTV